MEEIKDSNGKTIEDGDIIECPEEDINSARRYHMASIPTYSDSLEIRDLGHNNLDSYKWSGPYYVIGKFWEHLDKLRSEELPLRYFKQVYNAGFKAGEKLAQSKMYIISSDLIIFDDKPVLENWVKIKEEE